jgi:hypothetical protein
MDPNVVAAIIGGTSGLGGAIIGGLIAARATNKATKEANTHALRMQQTAQNAIVRGVLMGIRAEITTLWRIYTSQFGTIFEQLNDGEALFYHYPLHQNYFSVYESNAPVFGQIPDDDVRKAIVTTYLRAHGVIDSHHCNNQMIEKYGALQRLRDETKSSRYNGQIDAELASLKEYGRFMKQNYFEMKALVRDLTQKIDAHLQLTEGASSRLLT